MIVARVLVGHSVQGHSSMTEFPERVQETATTSAKLFDSLHGSYSGGRIVVSCNRDYQAYAEYVICFKQASPGHPSPHAGLRFPGPPFAVGGVPPAFLPPPPPPAPPPTHRQQLCALPISKSHSLAAHTGPATHAPPPQITAIVCQRSQRGAASPALFTGGANGSLVCWDGSSPWFAWDAGVQPAPSERQLKTLEDLGVAAGGGIRRVPRLEPSPITGIELCDQGWLLWAHESGQVLAQHAATGQPIELVPRRFQSRRTPSRVTLLPSIPVVAGVLQAGQILVASGGSDGHLRIFLLDRTAGTGTEQICFSLPSPSSQGATRVLDMAIEPAAQIGSKRPVRLLAACEHTDTSIAAASAECNICNSRALMMLCLHLTGEIPCTIYHVRFVCANVLVPAVY